MRALVALILVFIAVPGIAQARLMDTPSPTARISVHTIAHQAQGSSDSKRSSSEDCLYPNLAKSDTGRKYLRLRQRVVKKFNKDKPGLNIVCWGIGKPSHRHRPHTSKVNDGIAQFSNWLTPSAPAKVYSSDAIASTATPVTSGGGGSPIPQYIVDCESGGDYTARNKSGAYGKYQIMPGTAAGYGCNLSTPAGQDSCAAAIYAKEGAAPWDCG